MLRSGPRRRLRSRSASNAPPTTQTPNDRRFIVVIPHRYNKNSWSNVAGDDPTPTSTRRTQITRKHPDPPTPEMLRNTQNPQRVLSCDPQETIQTGNHHIPTPLKRIHHHPDRRRRLQHHFHTQLAKRRDRTEVVDVQPTLHRRLGTTGYSTIQLHISGQCTKRKRLLSPNSPIRPTNNSNPNSVTTDSSDGPLGIVQLPDALAVNSCHRRSTSAWIVFRSLSSRSLNLSCIIRYSSTGKPLGW